MATIILYPVSDVSLTHTCSSGSSGYLMIDDPQNSPDDSSTTIYKTSSGDQGNTSDTTSIFKMGGTSLQTNQKVYITALSYRARCYRSNNGTDSAATTKIAASINNGSYTEGSSHSLTTSWTNYNASLSPSGLNQTYNSFDAANIRTRVYSSATQGKNGSVSSYVTQVYFTVTYLPYFNFSVGGSVGCTYATVSSADAKEGDTVTFTATPMSSYRFIGWYSDSSYTTLVSANTSYQVTASADTTLYAKALRVCTVTVHGSDHFTASVSPSSGIAGDVCVATATHSTGIASFDGWFSDAARTQRVYPYPTYEITLASSDIELWVGSTLRFGLYHKINGQWVLMNKVYRKENGVWVIKENPDQIMSTDVKYIDRTQQ